MASWRRWTWGKELRKADGAGGWESSPKGDGSEAGQGGDTWAASRGRLVGDVNVVWVRQGGGGFECLILTSQVTCAWLSPLSVLSPLSSSPHLAHQPSPERGTKSPIYLSRSPASHLRRPQLPAQLLIDHLSGCLLFWWVTGACVTVENGLVGVGWGRPKRG